MWGGGGFTKNNFSKNCHLMYTGSRLKGHWQILHELFENLSPGADAISTSVLNNSYEVTNLILEKIIIKRVLKNDLDCRNKCYQILRLPRKH